MSILRELSETIDKAIKYWILIGILAGIINLSWFYFSTRGELAPPTFLFGADLPLSFFIGFVLVFPFFYILFRLEFIRKQLSASRQSAGKWVVFYYLFIFISIAAVVGLGLVLNPILSYLKIEATFGAAFGYWVGALLSILITYLFRKK